MTKYNYTIELTIKYPMEVTAYELDEETKNMLLESEDISDTAYDVADNPVHTEVVMNIDDLYDTSTFKLEVKDEEDNIIYSTSDPKTIKAYLYISDDKEDEDSIYLEYDPLPTGSYLIENNNTKWTYITFQLETDKPFDASKLAFYPSQIFDYYLCEDDVHLSNLAYNGNLIEDKEVEYYDNFGIEYTIRTSDGQCFSGYRL